MVLQPKDMNWQPQECQITVSDDTVGIGAEAFNLIIVGEPKTGIEGRRRDTGDST